VWLLSYQFQGYWTIKNFGFPWINLLNYVLYQEGTANYLKGLMLILCYLIVAASFFVHVDPTNSKPLENLTWAAYVDIILPHSRQPFGFSSDSSNKLDELRLYEFNGGDFTLFVLINFGGCYSFFSIGRKLLFIDKKKTSLPTKKTLYISAPSAIFHHKTISFEYN